MGEEEMVLPPGLQFDPTDYELIVYFLCKRAESLPCHPNIIPDLDIYASDPWELNGRAFRSKAGWYFFSRLKQNRSTRKGFWKEIGSSKPIFTSDGNEVGIKKYLVFHGDQVGSCTDQTNWIMEEYHLLKSGLPKKTGSQMQQDTQDTNQWVLCRVHYEADLAGHPEERDYRSVDDDGVELSYLDETFFSMEDDQEEVTSQC